jgi:hypothetical protein
MAKHNMRLERERERKHIFTARAGGLFLAAQRRLVAASLGQLYQPPSRVQRVFIQLLHKVFRRIQKPHKYNNTTSILTSKFHVDYRPFQIIARLAGMILDQPSHRVRVRRSDLQ